jgi:D-3-phosphoglycerate dehydrogenase
MEEARTRLDMPTVLVTDSDFPDADLEREVLREVDATVEVADARSPEEVVEAARSVDPDALLVQYARIDRSVFEAVDGLAVVGRYGIGVDSVDLEAATDHGVRVVNVPSYCEEEVSTHALSLLLALVRRVASLDAAVADGTWDWTAARPVHRMRGRTLGLAGFGKIPRHLLRKVEAFGVEIVAYDPYVSADELAEEGVEEVDFGTLLDRSDYVSVHTPLTEETEDLFDAEAFDRMKETAILVNTSRGAVVDTTALYNAVADDQIAGAGLDVLPHEPPEDTALAELDDVLVTPHMAWYSEESFETLRRTVSEDVATVLAGEEPENPVNDV